MIILRFHGMTKLAHEFNDFNDPCFLSFTPPPHPPGAIHNSDMLLILIILKTTLFSKIILWQPNSLKRIIDKYRLNKQTKYLK